MAGDQKRENWPTRFSRRIRRSFNPATGYRHPKTGKRRAQDLRVTSGRWARA